MAKCGLLELSDSTAPHGWIRRRGRWRVAASVATFPGRVRSYLLIGGYANLAAGHAG
ncbi:MAG TPA: hypothetical protein VFQ25_13945 [Ktedonobacterales bacterium]|nr:hypothetical protein [Ktedonobacterales bacterium]